MARSDPSERRSSLNYYLTTERLCAKRSVYEWSSLSGLLLAAMFAEWIATPVLMLRRYRGVTLPQSQGTRGNEIAPAGLASGAVAFGVQLIGAAYLAMGLIGFLPVEAINPIYSEGGARYLLRFFAISPMHNLVHLAIGVSGLWVGRNLGSARLWGKAVGVLLLLLFVMGIGHAWSLGFPRDHVLVGAIALNSAGHVFHLATGVVAIVLGVSRIRTDEATPP